MLSAGVDMTILETSVAKGGVGVRNGLLLGSATPLMSEHKSTGRLYLEFSRLVLVGKRALNQEIAAPEPLKRHSNEEETMHVVMRRPTRRSSGRQ